MTRVNDAVVTGAAALDRLTWRAVLIACGAVTAGAFALIAIGFTPALIIASWFAIGVGVAWWLPGPRGVWLLGGLFASLLVYATVMLSDLGSAEGLAGVVTGVLFGSAATGVSATVASLCRVRSSGAGGTVAVGLVIATGVTVAAMIV